MNNLQDLTLKEFIIKHVITNPGLSIYNAMDDPGFIFKQIRIRLEVENRFELLTAYLNDRVVSTFPQKTSYLDGLLYSLYGDRKISFIIPSVFTTISGNIISWDNGRVDFSQLIIERFADRWEQYLSELAIEYNPINNYDMHENEKVNSAITVTGDNEHTVQGFNSTTYKPESKDNDTHSTYGSADDNYRDLTRSGNIGVTTSQQMLESEIKLRDENIFIKRILQDVANFITVGVYE